MLLAMAAERMVSLAAGYLEDARPATGRMTGAGRVSGGEGVDVLSMKFSAGVGKPCCAKRSGIVCLLRSSAASPGCPLSAVLEDDAGILQLAADTVGCGEVLVFSRCQTLGDQCLDRFRGQTACIGRRGRLQKILRRPRQ